VCSFRKISRISFSIYGYYVEYGCNGMYTHHYYRYIMLYTCIIITHYIFICYKLYCIRNIIITWDTKNYDKLHLAKIFSRLNWKKIDGKPVLNNCSNTHDKSDLFWNHILYKITRILCLHSTVT